MAKKRVLTEWENLSKAVKGDHAKKFNAILETLPDDEFMVHYPKILQYAIPKLQRVENNVKKEKDDVITIVHVTKIADFVKDIDEGNKPEE